MLDRRPGRPWAVVLGGQVKSWLKVGQCRVFWWLKLGPGLG